jgi:hypothetical protein
MPKDLDEMTLEELTGFAIDNNIDTCGICRYTSVCDHRVIKVHEGYPAVAPCCDDADKWVDEDALREKVKEVHK